MGDAMFDLGSSHHIRDTNFRLDNKRSIPGSFPPYHNPSEENEDVTRTVQILVVRPDVR